MAQDQCPSTKGHKTPNAEARELATVAGRVSGTGASGPMKAWRSPEEFADAPEFRDWVEREFPAGASELEHNTRRDFVKLMGASLALAGAATIPGCRRPDHKIMSYSSEVPEEVIPGTPLFFATSFPLPGGGAEGLVVETHTGRPTKVEGNPLHPISQGASSAWAQASVLGLYDPDRLKFPVFNNPARGRLDATWDDFRAWQGEHFAKFDATRGSGLAFVVDRVSSPTRDAMKARVMERWPDAMWVSWDPVADETGLEGARAAFGQPQAELLSLDKAKVLLTLDRDVVQHEPGALVNARGMSAARRVMHSGDAMSRVYSVESTVTLTGGMADHRLALASSRIPAFAVALAQKLGESVPAIAAMARDLAAPTGEDIDAEFVEAVAEDLLAHRGEGLIVAGRTQPGAVRALVHGLNEALGNTGTTVSYRPLTGDAAESPAAWMRTLTRSMAAGAIDTLVVVGANPVYDTPNEIGFEAAMAQVNTTVTLSVAMNETEALSTWSLNGQHPLESWGDTEANDGTIAPIQPMIAPIYDPAMSEVEFLALLAGEENPDGYELVRAEWSRRLNGLSGDSFETAWRRALHNGVLPGTTDPGDQPSVNAAAVTRAVASLRVPAAPSEGDLEVVFTTGQLRDGRYANLSWLQELPHDATRVVWDNPVLMSPKTARDLGVWAYDDPNDVYTGRQIPKARMAVVSVNGTPMELPAWVCPGMPDGTLALELGYGRTKAGAIADGVGFDVTRVRPGGGVFVARGATCERGRGRYQIVSTQNHWSLEGRETIIREADKPAWDKYGDELKVKPDPIYGEPVISLNFAERLGELSHTPENRSIYDNPYNNSPDAPDAENLTKDHLGRPIPPQFSRGPQWGMTIDMSTCTGCGVCTIACQAENNIPVVGKREVAKGREMHWIRVDRYFLGDDLDHPEGLAYQPIACVHCENAPCEVVCPVNATVHDDEGLNAMVYNRCIGTRYCSNNCPYKVRRFNFFDYSQAKFKAGSPLTEAVGVEIPNENFIPPRLRKKLDEIQKMKMNPDVTVRGRGVMEKCTYCVQRINRARYELKLQDISPADMPDGFFQAACQQACPSQSIAFGNILDETSKVAEARKNGRSFGLLNYINTRPRTNHLLRVRNPNPKLRKPYDEPFHHGKHDDHGDGHGSDHGHDHGDGHSSDHGSDHGEAHSAATKRRTLKLPVLGEVATVPTAQDLLMKQATGGLA
ncbi:MAG: TAT-variant-translocated molybdopterin oxidoreductase [Planctomycetota bacterium]